MTPETKAKMMRFLTGAAIASLVGGLTALSGVSEDGISKADLILALGAAGAALRLWLAKQTSSLPVLLGATEEEYFTRVKVMPVGTVTGGPALFMGGPLPTSIEIRRFSDERLQAAVEYAFQVAERDGAKNGMFFNVNMNGEVCAGVAVKIGGHLSIGGFLEKRPGAKLEGLAEATFTF